MSFLDLAKARYSVRKFSKRSVEQEKIDAILEAANLAPTGCNRQPQRILVVDDPEVLAKIRLCTSCQFGAPLTFVICVDMGESWVNLEGEAIGEIDASIVTTHMQLEIAELGLGSCWVACFDRAKLCKELSIPARFRPVALLPVGYPADNASPAHYHNERKKLSDYVWRNHF